MHVYERKNRALRSVIYEVQSIQCCESNSRTKNELNEKLNLKCFHEISHKTILPD